MGSNSIAIALGSVGIDTIMDIIAEQHVGANVTVHDHCAHDISIASYTATSCTRRTVWCFGQGGSDYTDIYSGDRTLIHMGANEESVSALRSVLSTTGGFLLENDGDDRSWQIIEPTNEHILSPNAQFALDIAKILDPKAIELLRPLFNDPEKLAELETAINRRLNSTATTDLKLA